MKNILLITFLMLWAAYAIGQVDPTSSGGTNEDDTFVENATKFRIFESSWIKIDLKLIDPDLGTLGVDYDFNLERNLLKDEDEPLKGIDLGLKSKGFVTVTGNNNAQNSIVSELNLKAKGYPIGKRGEIDAWWRTPRYLIDEDDIIEISRNRAAIVSSPLWMYFDIHAKHETTQDFQDYDFAFGGSLAFTTSFLNALLDIPFGFLRSSENNLPRQLDLSIGYDYVTGLENTSNENLRDGQNTANRLNFRGEWETGIFNQERLSFLFDSYYEMDAPDMIVDADKDFNYFFQIKLEHILAKSHGTTSKIAIKYTRGELPPNFEKGYVLGGGFSVDF